MIALLCFFLSLLASPFKSKSRLEAENAALRHQLIVVQRKMRGRVHLKNGDRLFLVQLYRWFPSVLKTITIIRPETLVRWHRAGFRRYWRWKSRSLGGRPKIDADLCALIRRAGSDSRPRGPRGRQVSGQRRARGAGTPAFPLADQNDGSFHAPLPTGVPPRTWPARRQPGETPLHPRARPIAGVIAGLTQPPLVYGPARHRAARPASERTTTSPRGRDSRLPPCRPKRLRPPRSMRLASLV
jgi:hypothetical protein